MICDNSGFPDEDNPPLVCHPVSCDHHHAKAVRQLERLVGPVHNRIFCAPLVRGSELAFRMLVRSHGVSVCYTPMLKADVLLAGGAEERRLLEQCEGDEPLIAQLCGRDPNLLAEAARLVVRTLRVHAVDLNLGCPQVCAKEGRYGAFLQEEPDVVAACVAALASAVSPIPVFCKMRILPSVHESVAFAQTLQKAGCSLLAVHCRTREAKHDGPPDYSHLASLVSALQIPVLANGGISSLQDAETVLSETGAVAAMVATALLRCPRAFDTGAASADTVDMALEYLDFAERFPPPSPLYLRKHLRWIFRSELGDSYRAARAGWLDGVAEDCADWKARAWNFLEQPYLVEILQFRKLVQLIAELRSQPEVTDVPGCAITAFRAIRTGDDGEQNEEEEPDVSWLFDGVDA